LFQPPSVQGWPGGRAWINTATMVTRQNTAVYLITGRNTRGPGSGDAEAYDAIVMDAPPTGRIARFLNVNSEVSGLARVGPIRNHADLVMGVIASPATAVHLVTLLEEMPVQETMDGVAELRSDGLPVGGIVVNMTRPPMLTPDQMERATTGTLPVRDITAALASCGLGAHEAAIVPALLREAADHAQRVALEERERARVAQLGLPTFELPLLGGGVDLGGLYELADLLREGGM
ncbi:MAG: DUF1800 family protein, partial [Phycisphaerales bacterium]